MATRRRRGSNRASTTGTIRNSTRSPVDEAAAPGGEAKAGGGSGAAAEGGEEGEPGACPRAGALRAAAARVPGRAEGLRAQSLDQPGDARTECPAARRRARRFRRARRDHQCPPRSGGDALRARAGTRHQVGAGDRPRRRHCPLDERHRLPRCRHPRQERDRHRAPQCPARDGLSPRAPRRGGLRLLEGAPRPLPRQDHRRRAGDRRSRPHAASSRRRHHRLRQVGVDQHHDPVAPLQADAGGVPDDHDRPEDAGAFDL